jgi:hypothetical protein
MTNEETAREVDEIKSEVGPLLQDRSHLASALALTLMAAHHVLHDGGAEDDFMAVARTAWERSKETHRKSCS